MATLFSEAEARDRILAAAGAVPVRAEPCELWAAGDRVAAADFHARIPLPGFDNSSVDGYAVRSEEVTVGGRFQVQGTQAAGFDTAQVLTPGHALRIFTGAPLPGGADAVLMQEDCTRDGDVVVAQAHLQPGENVRRCGDDLARGQRMIAAGTVLRAPQLGLLATQGYAQVSVWRRPTVSIIATGSELRPADEALRPGEIHESNRVMLADLVRRAGGLPRVLPIIPDEPSIHREAFGQAQGADVIVVAGGVSVGDHDLVKPTLRELGASLDLWRVALRPGKPFLFGKLGQSLVFGLPGNPVSAFVTFLRFVRPALLRLAGCTAVDDGAIPAVADETLRNDGDRPHYVRVRCQNGRVRLSGRQESHALFALSQANALVRLAPDQVAQPGETVDVFRFSP